MKMQKQEEVTMEEEQVEEIMTMTVLRTL